MGVAAESAAADVGVRSMRPGDVTEALAEVWRSLAESARPSYPRLATVDPPSLA